MTILAETHSGNKKRIIGISSLTVDVNAGTAGEFAILVHDDFQKRGLAVKLLDVLIGIAEERGLSEFYGFIEPINGRMAHLCDKLGMTRSRSLDDLTRVAISLN
jgi:acetyltransferase